MRKNCPQKVPDACGMYPCTDTDNAKNAELVIFSRKVTLRQRINFSSFFQLGFLDTVTDGVEVSRQDLGRGQYRWTITFLDEGDDFDLVPQHEYVSTDPNNIDPPPSLSISLIDPTASPAAVADPTGLSVTTTKVRLGVVTNRCRSQDEQHVARRECHVADP